jgi:hypothetical protein
MADDTGPAVTEASQDRSGAFDADTLRRALLALADGDAETAATVVDACHDLDAAVRRDLEEALLADEPADVRARAVGDRLLAAGLAQDLVNEAYRAAFYLGDGAVRLAENPLYAYFLAHRSGPALDKWVHYFPVYHRHLERFRGTAVRVLEIGVYRGGGLAMWRHYFGPDATVVGLDVDPAAREAAGEGAVVELGDQADPEVLRRVDREHGPFDVVIDDGGHRMDQQRTTAETLFPLLAEGGVLVVEDCHTSYWPEYGGGRDVPGTFVEWVKERIDAMHWRYTASDPDTVWASALDGLHVYDSVVVLDKNARFRPFNEIAGTSAYLRTDRAAEAHLLDLVAARDAARLQAEGLEAEIARLGGRIEPPPRPELEEELRRVQAALRWSQAELAAAGAQVAELTTERNSLNGQLQESWDQVHLMRRSVSWRLTAPLRAVRSLLR